MQAVFHSPVAPGGLGQRLGRVDPFGADVERALHRHLALDLALALDQPDACEVFPLSSTLSIQAG